MASLVATTASPSHLASLEDSGSVHLVSVSQTTNWNNKELVATPIDKRFVCVSAWGKPSYPTTEYGGNVKADYDQLVERVTTRLAALGVSHWQTGDKAVASWFTRYNSPWKIHTNTSNAGGWGEVGQTRLALQFNLRRLHLSRLTSFTPYLRVYTASLLTCRADTPFGVLFSGGLLNNASHLRYGFDEDLIKPVSNPACAYQTENLVGKFNNQTVVNRDTLNSYGFTYDIYDDFVNGNTVGVPDLPLKVFATSASSPVKYHTDIQLADDTKNWLAAHTGKIWLYVHFNWGNGVSAGGNAGLQLGVGVLVFISRVELVLKCTGGRF